MEQKAYKAALEWYLESGVDEALASDVLDRFAMSAASAMPSAAPLSGAPQPQSDNAPAFVGAAPMLGAADARLEAAKLAKSANTLEELSEIIAGFDGIGLKKTASNMVFCDGNPNAHVMLIGEAPGDDEDRTGKPFGGMHGQLLDKILKAIGLDRSADDAAQGVYLSNLLNWRPPGNRTLAPGEIEASLPFIERHIQLAQPKVIILCGAIPAKALLGRTDGLSKMRKKWHDYMPQTPELQGGGASIPAIVSFHPSYLLRNPAQKRAVWEDMLSLKQKLRSL